jgi:hypothetical protein
MSRIVFVIFGVAALLGGLNAMALIYDLAVLASAHLATAIVAALFALTAALVGGVGLELSRALTGSASSPLPLQRSLRRLAALLSAAGLMAAAVYALCLVGIISRQATGTPVFG